MPPNATDALEYLQQALDGIFVLMDGGGYLQHGWGAMLR